MSKNAEQRLIEVGIDWLKRGGVRGMRLRRICAEAGVSPGTFTAYFPTLNDFCERILMAWYEPLRTAVERQSNSNICPLARLRAELSEALHFLHANAPILMQLIMDVNAGETNAFAALKLAQAGHLAQVRQALQAAQEAGFLVEGPPQHLLIFLMGAVGLPLLLFHTIEEKLPDDITIYDGLHNTVTEQALLERLDWALKGISK